MGFQFLAHRIAFHRFEARVQGLDGSELRDELLRGLGSDAGNSGNIVRVVSHEAEQVDDLVRPYAPFLLNFPGPDDFRIAAAPALAEREHLHVIREKLHHVLVAGDEKSLDSGAFGPGRQGGHQVVRLEAFHLDQGNLKRLHDAPYGRKLVDQVIRHLFARGLVFLVRLVAERRSGRVEQAGDVIRFFIAEDLQQSVGEAERPAGVDSLGIDQGRPDEREIGPVGERGTVEQEKSFTCAVRRHSAASSRWIR